MINSLQSLRGIFAIMIFLSHFTVNSDGARAFYPGGTMGVEFFIMLSGFVMCAGYEKIVELNRISYKNFMLRRLIRLFPLHLLCLILWMVVFNNYSLKLGLLANVLMIQAWVPLEGVYYGYNTPSWCLGVFMFLYAVFPMIISFYYHNSRRAIKVLGGFIIIFIAYIMIIPTTDVAMEVWLSRILPPVRLVDFAIGMALWQIYRRIKDHSLVNRLCSLSIGCKTGIEISVIALYALGAFLSTCVSAKWSSELVWWVPTVCAIMLFSLTDGKGGWFGRVLVSKPLVVFGNASFCFYLLHVPVIAAVNRFANHFAWVLSPIAMLWITLAAGIILSLAVNRYFDQPLGHRLRRLLKL